MTVGSDVGSGSGVRWTRVSPYSSMLFVTTTTTHLGHLPPQAHTLGFGGVLFATATTSHLPSQARTLVFEGGVVCCHHHPSPSALENECTCACGCSPPPPPSPSPPKMRVCTHQCILIVFMKLPLWYLWPAGFWPTDPGDPWEKIFHRCGYEFWNENTHGYGSG